MYRTHLCARTSQALTVPLDSELVMSIAYSVARTDGRDIFPVPSYVRQDLVRSFAADTILPSEGRWHQVSAEVNGKEIFIWFDMQSICEDDAFILGMNISAKDLILAVRDAKSKIFVRRDEDEVDPMLIEGNTSII